MVHFLFCFVFFAAHPFCWIWFQTEVVVVQHKGCLFLCCLCLFIHVHTCIDKGPIGQIFLLLLSFWALHLQLYNSHWPNTGQLFSTVITLHLSTNRCNAVRSLGSSLHNNSWGSTSFLCSTLHVLSFNINSNTILPKQPSNCWNVLFSILTLYIPKPIFLMILPPFNNYLKHT